MSDKTKVYGGWLNDNKEVLKSSSGGAFTALSDVFLKSGDAVVCSTYNYDTHFQEFKIITTEKERNEARGSKYVQAITGNIFIQAENWLKNNPDKRLLCVGTGCQAAGFSKYAEIKGFKDRVVIVDMICHGAPSPKVWKQFVRRIEKKHGKIEYVTMRDKRKGWKTPTAYVLIDGKEILIKEYMRLFYSCVSIRPCCNKCPYAAMQRKTDMTIGDFWHLDEKRPQACNKAGTSLFLVHSSKGLELFESIKPRIKWFESNTSECWQMNLEKPTPKAKNRDRFWQDYNTRGIDYVVKKYGKISVLKKIAKKTKSMIKKIIRR